jgi:vacuolar-type H+-ATPase subunit F/Vma7
VFGVRATFDEGTVETVEDACDWLELVMSCVEQEMDRRRRFRVALSDIHGLGTQGIGNLREEYESLSAVAAATEAEPVEIPYVTEDLAPEMLTAAEQFDDDAMHQGLKHRGIGRFRINDFLTETVRRTFDTRRELIGKYKRKPMVLTIPELATVAHIPTTLEHDRFHFDAHSIEWAETGAMENVGDDEDAFPESVSGLQEG